MATSLTGICLPALIALTGLVATNQLWLWLRHRSEQLHLSWAIWCGLGVAFLVARFLHHTATDGDSALLAVRLQYAIGYAMMVSLLLVIRDQVMRPPERRTIVAVAASTVLLGAAMFVDGVVVTGPAYLRTDLLGQTFLDARPGRLTLAYTLLLVVTSAVCLQSVIHHGGAMTRARRFGVLFTLGAVSAAGVNDLLMIFGVQTLRLAEFATVAIALSADHLMVHDYHRMLGDMEGRVGERTAALRAATASARRTEESFRALIDASPDAVIVERDGAVVFANAAAAQFFGEGTSLSLLGLDPLARLHPDDLAGAQAALFDVRARRGPSNVQEERYVVDGGDTHVAETIRVPLVFEGSDSVVTILRDVTDRARMEEQLQFSARMASLGTLAAGVAHEINNPMSYVLANLEFLREILVESPRPGAAASSEVEELIAEAEDGARRVVHIVRDLKSFSRRRDDEPLSPVALEEVLDAASEMALVQIRHSARLERDYAGTTLILGNRVQLGQVFLNLVVNAAQAIPEGGDADDNSIVLRTYLDSDGRAVAEVEDSGPGIDPAIRSRIFDPFFTTKPVGVGTGLGLSSALGIVASLGGNIEVDSRVGSGTVVRVRFQAVPRELAAPSAPRRATRARPASQGMIAPQGLAASAKVQ